MIDVSVQGGDWPPDADLEAWCARCTAVALATGLKIRPGTELSVVFTDDAAIKDLNATWRAKNSATNVLSFPASDPDGDTYGPFLGDIVLAQETTSREADELGIELSDHIAHLIVHGFLHLFGYDHQDDADAEVMETLERRIMADLGLNDPYADRPLLADGP
ncbi:rRNA maturation RNase YbeY [Roseibium aquae]|nr:rRNA maturation RNase YbeY [Roseibium aquae]